MSCLSLPLVNLALLSLSLGHLEGGRSGPPLRLAGPGTLSPAAPLDDPSSPRAHDWADLRENQMINPAPGFWPIFGPLGPAAGPGSPGSGPVSQKQCRLHQNSEPKTNSKSHSWVLCACGTDRYRIERYLINLRPLKVCKVNQGIFVAQRFIGWGWIHN